MAIGCVGIENFKAFRERVDVPLRPITVFIGANSAGKSSVIHALAALKQSAQRQMADRALLLDGPDAFVSLGRYADAVHAHDYRKQIGLGFKFKARLTMMEAQPGKKLVRRIKDTELDYWWRFQGTLRTQRVHLGTRSTKVNNLEYTAKKKTGVEEYTVTRSGTSVGSPSARVQNLGFRVQPSLMLGTDSEYTQYAAWQNLNTADEAMLRELERIRYLGPFRFPPQRLYAYHGTTAGVGADGRGAIPLLISEMMGQRRPNLAYVQGWLRRLGLVDTMRVTRQGASDSFRVEVRSSESAESATPADVGFGFSQVLPVVVQCAFAEVGGTYLFEQPEIHLHPTAQKRLGEFFADALSRIRGTYVLETHSLHLVQGLQAAVRAGGLEPNDVKIYAVRAQNGVSCLRSYNIDADGDLWDEWERGFETPWE